MSWKSLLPKKITVDQLSFEQCRAFSDYYKILTRKVGGPVGYRIFYRYNLHLLMYGMCCIDENKFPALNRCHDELSEYFLTDTFDNEWMVYLWIFCDFPAEKNSNRTTLDYFYDFLTGKENTTPKAERVHLDAFYQAMSNSRLGLYEEILSTKKVTKFRELFSGKVISTFRSVPDYESGELFVGRIVSYLGNSFLIHDPRCFPPTVKGAVEKMYKDKFFYISDTMDDAVDYDAFMRLAGPYTMSVTNADADVPVLSPDQYEIYYR